MDYFVIIGDEQYGPYDSWETAYMFARENFGFLGWEISKTDNKEK